MSFPDEHAAPANGLGAVEPEEAGATPASDPSQEAEQLRTALAEAQNRAQESHASYLRALAEVDNIRKRAVRDVEQAHKFALEKFAADLIGVKDSLEMGLVADAADAQSVRAGTEATLKLLEKAFAKAGLTEVIPQGERFNPEFLEAMALQPSTEQPPDTVLQVVQKGYVLNGRLVRPARVLVAREP
jgi:molecular chaperone GrpE